MEQQIHLPIDSLALEGDLVVPEGALGIVIFSHGSGSGRFSPRNNFVAKVLQEHNLATLLLDLLTPQEDEVYENRFNIDLLTDRLLLAINWVKKSPETQKLKIELFGASTGAASALRAAAFLGPQVAAIVSRGGRPDLALEVLDKIQSPVLFIVGGNDELILELNQEALEKIPAEKKLEIIPGATHLFEEPGALEEVARLAANWFKQYLNPV